MVVLFRILEGNVGAEGGTSESRKYIATQIRIERIGLKAYLAGCKVPGYESAECNCGWSHQTAKHILMHCPTWRTLRERLLNAVGTTDYRRIISTPSGLNTAAWMIMATEFLSQFSLAQILPYGEV